MAKPTDVLDDLFADIGPPPTTPSISNPAPTSTSTSTNPTKSEKDILAEFDLLTADRPTPASTSSRPSTPRGSIRKSLESRRPNLTSDLPRRSGEGYGINTNLTRRDSSDVNSKLQTPVDSNPPTFAVTSPAGISTPPPSSTPSRKPPPQQTSGGGEGGGGWWGSIFTTATSAISTAQHTITTAAQDHLTSLPDFEVQKLRTQATSLLSNAQTELRSRALPTLSNLLHTIVPPIASHEQLRIHITHDIQNYPSIDTIVYGVFDRVMQQVEGGDLLVVQKGRESKPRSSSDTGWTSGPWYKASEPRSLNPLIGGSVEEGVKLARAAAEGYALELTSTPGYIAEQDYSNPNNPTRKSDIFLAIQPVTHQAPAYLIPSTAEESEEGGEEDLITFALHLHDPMHVISYSTLSQAIPAKWLEWIDSPAHTLHDDIRAIVEVGGVDPREWVVEWVEETLGLAVGVVAQRYVAKRMNVGGGDVGVGKGKEREVVSGSGGGEVARAVGM